MPSTLLANLCRTANLVVHVRFGSKADICAATSHVRFTPNSDIDCVFRHVCLGQKWTHRDVLSASTLPFDLVIAIASCTGLPHLIARLAEEVLMAASARPRII